MNLTDGQLVYRYKRMLVTQEVLEYRIYNAREELLERALETAKLYLKTIDRIYSEKPVNIDSLGLSNLKFDNTSVRIGERVLYNDYDYEFRNFTFYIHGKSHSSSFPIELIYDLEWKEEALVMVSEKEKQKAELEAKNLEVAEEKRQKDDYDMYLSLKSQFEG